MGADRPKQFLELAGRPILLHTLQTFINTGLFSSIIVTTPAADQDRTSAMLNAFNLQHACRVLAGGPSRQDSVRIGLDALPATVDYVMVHDGVRPLVTAQIIAACLEEAVSSGAAITAIPVRDTIKSVNNAKINATIDRHGLWRAQTPQAARLTLLRQAYANAAEMGIKTTDEAALLELINYPVAIVEGTERNIKITVNEDLAMAEALLDKQTNHLKIGHGYDAHGLETGRKLVMGGVEIPHNRGLRGHSDADVVTHALCDALLGALGAGDIGRHFPDTDPIYKGISSLSLLQQVIKMTTGQGFLVVNADLTIIAQKPKLSPFIPQMQQNLARICQVSDTAINVKATTTEQMGFTGRQEGIACHAVALLSSV